MSSYTELLNALRAARAERDKARSELYNLLLQQLKLLRAQKKADRKEVVTDAATLAAITSLRERITADAGRLRRIEATLRELARPEQELRPDQALLAALMAEHDKLQTSLAQFEGKLNGPALSPAQRVALEAEREALLKSAETLQQRIEALKRKLAELQERLHNAPQQRGELEEERARLQNEITQLQDELDRLAATAAVHDNQSDALDSTRQRIAEQRRTLAEREKAVGALIGQLFLDLPPQKLIEEWSDNTPIMLLPLRL